LGISTELNGVDLTKTIIWIEDAGITFTKKQITITPRIGVDYAGEDAKLPYRFLVKEV
jgi:DNA-3-methyladenine glycosylase